MIEKDNSELYSEYQIYFNKLFDQHGYEYRLEDSLNDDDDINYMIKIDAININSEYKSINVLAYIDVLDHELTFFSIIEQDEQREFESKLQIANSLNAELSYGKIYVLDKYSAYMAKIQLPNNIVFFEEEVVDKCLFEVQRAIYKIREQ